MLERETTALTEIVRSNFTINLLWQFHYFVGVYSNLLATEIGFTATPESNWRINKIFGRRQIVIFIVISTSQ